MGTARRLPPLARQPLRRHRGPVGSKYTMSRPVIVPAREKDAALKECAA